MPDLPEHDNVVEKRDTRETEDEAALPAPHELDDAERCEESRWYSNEVERLASVRSEREGSVPQRECVVADANHVEDRGVKECWYAYDRH